MRIAICFSGQMRTAIESSPNLFRFFGNLDCDFFIHTWNINTTKPYNGVMYNSEIEYIPQTDIYKLINIYNPKKIEIENYDNCTISTTILPHHWYSFMKSVDMKHEYEIENGFIYDYVVKLRFDIIFPPKRRLIDDITLLGLNEIYIENFNDECINGKLWCDDVYFIGSSGDMDKASKYFNEVNRIQDESYLFTNHILNNGIKLVSAIKWACFHYDDYSYGIYRKECLGYSPLDDYENCFYCDHHYFDANVNCDEKKTYFINEKIKYIKR